VPPSTGEKDVAIDRMLRVQLLGHDSVREEVKLYLREQGILEVTDVTLDEPESGFDEEYVQSTLRLREQASSSIEFLDGYEEKRSFIERLGRGPLVVSRVDVEELCRDISVEVIWEKCSELQRLLRKSSDELARSRELVKALIPWIDVEAPLDSLSTDGYEVRFWTMPESAAGTELDALADSMPFTEAVVSSTEGGRANVAVIVSGAESEKLGEEFKKFGGIEHSFEGYKGTPAQIIEKERSSWSELESRIEEAEAEARGLAGNLDDLRVLLDHYNEQVELGNVERHLHRTERTFVLEGWIKAADRRRFERRLGERFEHLEFYFRAPSDDEEPPISLANRPVMTPYEFVTTLYGRPAYREVDPTPLLAPFFIVFFALCLTDAGYGLALSAVSAAVLLRFKPSGGARKLMRLLFMGGIATAAVGILTGGIFGIEMSNLPGALRAFVLINPLEEPMKMLNFAFLLGLLHMLFGMGIRMASNFKGGRAADAVFGDLLWILFLIALAPLGFSAILGGYVPDALLSISKRASLAIAVGIFLSGGRNQKGIVKKFFKGLIGFYDVVGYFGDVLSYARLLALGLATSAIALAVNGIASMVKGLPFYTGYVVAALVLVLGHGFNMAVNTLGAFVHSGRLQYLEFFSKFFMGGGREFKPFKSGRRYSVMERIEE
jgi:V/A-type H+-transporting ATPase subunit I